MAAVEDVNEEPENEPEYKPYPRNDGQTGHQTAAQNNRNQREPRHTRDAERARSIRLPPAEENHPERYQHKRKQRAYIRQISRIAYGKKAGGQAQRIPRPRLRYAGS